MKKTYMTPAIEAQEIITEVRLLTVSGGDTGIGYGGVDDGTFDPASRLLIGEPEPSWPAQKVDFE